MESNNKAITHKEIYTLDGKTVWVQDLGGLYKSGYIVIKFNELRDMICTPDEWYDMEEYGKEFVCYFNKPII